MFWDMVDVRGDNECWPIPVLPSGKGYRLIWIRGWVGGAHRAAFIEATGEEPAAVDHLCHNLDPSCPGGFTCPHRACCNPSHLAASTKRENLLASSLTLAAQNAAKTHCPQNHPYDAENTYVDPRGLRHCRECGRKRSREWQRQNRK